uniref:ARAD1C04268p n=1 Tax=Blastobotrys adeninivorans TaxID=409370 RepID=A0A060T5B6_BLAAD
MTTQVEEVDATRAQEQGEKLAPTTTQISIDPEKQPEVREAIVSVGYQYTPEEEKKVVRKLDWNILTYVSALYLLSYLDRGNIGNANTAGMSDDLGITGSQYEWFLTIFYISYIVFEFMTLLWKILPPRFYVPCVVIGWGVISTCTGAVQNWSGMMALRFLLGICEAGFGPGVPYYLSFFYYRHEIGRRTGIFIAVSPLASAFSGALAYGITSHKLAIASWRVLFIVEGLPTILVGIIGFFVLPNDANSCRFLNEDEKKIAAARTVRQTGRVDRGGRSINFKEILQTILDVKCLVPCLIFFSINVGFSSLPVFMPAIIEGMGFESVRANGLSAPPYVVTTVVVVLMSFLSDRIMQRGYLICAISIVGAVGYLLLAVCKSTGVRYFAVYLASAGVFPCVPILMTWQGNNQGSDTKKGTAFMLLQMIGQCGPLLGTRIFPKTDGPYYTKGLWISFGFQCLVAALTLFLRFYLKWQNRKLDEKYGPAEGNPLDAVDAMGMEGDENPNFRYIL